MAELCEAASKEVAAGQGVRIANYLCNGNYAVSGGIAGCEAVERLAKSFKARWVYMHCVVLFCGLMGEGAALSGWKSFWARWGGAAEGAVGFSCNRWGVVLGCPAVQSPVARRENHPSILPAG